MAKSPKVLHIKLTDDQKRDLLKFIQATGEVNLDIGVQFNADIKAGVVAPATFVVGAAV